jgi:TatA/E family protein of Tat protein translocase
MPFNIGPGELIIVLIIALIVVGPGKLPDVGAALGKSIKEFRKAATDVKESTSLDTAPAAASPTPATTATAATAAPAAAPIAAAIASESTAEAAAPPAPAETAPDAPVPAAPPSPEETAPAATSDEQAAHTA